MKIVVCIKQVPDIENIEINKKDNTINRSNIETIVNPDDIYAIEEAIILKEKLNATVLALTMGPEQSEAALREAISRGIDNGYLITDKHFAGADTYATSYTLFKAIQTITDFNLIICGRHSIDGETAQVPVELAEFFNIPSITNVIKILKINKKEIQCETLSSYGTKIITATLPALITVTKAINIPRLVTLNSLFKGYNAEIRKLNINDINVNKEEVGLKGSLTIVKKIKTVTYNKKCTFLKGTPSELAKSVIKIINDNLEKNDNKVDDISLPEEREIDNEKKIFIIGDSYNYKITKGTYQLTYIGRKLSKKSKSSLNLIILTDNADRIKNGNKLPTVHNLYILEHKSFKSFNYYIHKEAIINLLKEEKPNIVLAISSYEGRELLSSIAVKVKGALTADCTELDISEDDRLIQIRPTYGGNILATIESKNRYFQMATVRENSYPFIEPRYKPNNIIIKKIDSNFLPKVTIDKTREKNQITHSDIIISGGKGIGSKHNFDLIKKAAVLLDATIGSSRPAVDSGWIDFQYQIGQTGKIVSPKVYIACGISGSTQHIYGIQSSKIIIAINKDKNANIFKVADYGIIEDYKVVIEKIINELEQSNKSLS